MEDDRYTLEALLQAPAVDGDLDRLRYLIERLPLLVSRLDTAAQYGDRSQLRSLAHDGKGLYADLGTSGDHFTHLYAVAVSASPVEIESAVEMLRSEAARLGKILRQADGALG